MALLDKIGIKTDKLRESLSGFKPLQNLKAWGQVATNPSVRRDYSRYVVKPQVKSFVDKRAQFVPFTPQYRQSQQQAQRQLQNIKLPTYKAPSWSTTAKIAKYSPVAAAAIKGLPTGISSVQEQLRSYGRGSERLSTPEGRKEFVKGFNPKEYKGKSIMEILTSPTLETSLDIADFLPPLAIGAQAAKQSLRAQKILLNEDVIKKAIASIENFERFRKVPHVQIENMYRVKKVAQSLIPNVVNSKDMKKLESADPTRWLNTVGEYLRDSLDLAKNPIKGFRLGGSIKEVSRGDKALLKATKGVGGEIAKPSKAEKYAFNINKEKLGLDSQSAQKLDETVEMMRPVLEKNKGKTLTKKEIIESGRKANVLQNVVSRDEAAKFAESLQATRNYIKKASKEEGLTKEYIEQLEILSSTAADAGRKLKSFDVLAEDAGIKEQVIKELTDIGVSADELLKAAKKVDWDNADEVTDFYRKFKPATLAEKLEEFRYTNMLSSPNTHINNIFSNVLQSAIVAPIEKGVAGGIDWAVSSLTGKERQYYASQGVDYAKGYWKALPEAIEKFKGIMSSSGTLTKPDVRMIPTNTSKLRKAYSTPLRALEGADQFFRTLVKVGEERALARVGVTGAEAAKKAEQLADYRLFRQKFDPDGKLGQGGVLKLWDKWNSVINNLRRLPGGNWIVPFLQTPTNILKQGVEFSPLGVITAPGSKEPIVQLAKSMVGSTVFVSAYSLADAGLTTWDAPTSSEEKSEFYAAGLQPYSIKIGDKWYSYSKLGPLSYPIAMAAAMKWAKDNGASEGSLSVAGQGAGGFLQFFADQSYVRGIGDVIDAIRGDEYKQGRAFANIPGQLVPYRSFFGWLTRLVDPIYRKTTGGSIPEQTYKSIASQVPGLSQTLPAYETPFGEQSRRDLPAINALSPIRVSVEKPFEKEYYEKQLSERKLERLSKEWKKSIDEGEVLKATTFDAILGKGSDKMLEVDKYSVAFKLYELGEKPKNPIELAKWEEEAFDKGVKILGEDIDDEMKEKLITRLGLNMEDMTYYGLASDDTSVRKAVVDQVISQATDSQSMIDGLVGLRKEVHGQRVLSNNLIDDLVDEGIITYQQGKDLKKVEWDSKTSSPKVKKSSSKAKTIKIPDAVKKGVQIPKAKFTKTPAPKISIPERKLKITVGDMLKLKSPSVSSYVKPITVKKQGVFEGYR